MKRTTTMKTSAELRAELETMVKELNDANLGGKSVTEINTKKAAIAEQVKLLNGKLTEDCYVEFLNLAEGDDPKIAMERALTQLSLPAVRVKENKKDNVFEVESTKVTLDLLGFYRFAKPLEIAADSSWSNYYEQAGLLFAGRAAKELEIDEKEVLKNYKLSKSSENLRTQDAVPTSATHAEKVLQKLVDMIIFKDNGSGKNVYKVMKKDVAYADMLLVSKAREERTVKVPSQRTVINVLVNVINRIVTSKPYAVELNDRTIIVGKA